jgi:hypothetical protein
MLVKFGMRVFHTTAPNSMTHVEKVGRGGCGDEARVGASDRRCSAR